MTSDESTVPSNDEETRADGGDPASDDASASPNSSSEAPSSTRKEVDPTSETSQADAPSSETLQTSRCIADRYRLLEPLDSGGMGTIYRAEHMLLEKEVAVKLLHSELSDNSEFVERFHREARAAAHLDHPHICSVTDFGLDDDGSFYMVMELLDGESLADRLDREGPFPPERAIEVLKQLAKALACAHDHDVVHRDLKPANIFLTPQGREGEVVKVLDFGIARVPTGDESETLTQTGVVLGTPTYMAPEQAAGDPVDARTDLYALGLIAFEMLAGRPVFEADRQAKVMARHVSTPPPMLSDVVSPERPLPDRLERIVRQLLAKDPAKRPQSADALRAMLDGDRDPASIPTRPVRTASDTSVASAEGGDVRENDADIETVPAEASDDDRPMLVALVASGLEWFREQSKGVRFGLIGGGAGMGLAGLLLTTGALLYGLGLVGGAPSAETMRTQLEAQREQFLERESVAEAMDRYRSGEDRRALESLETLERDVYPDNPHLAYLLGRLHVESGHGAKGFNDYIQAVDLEADYIVDERLLADAIAAFGDDEAMRATAFELLQPHLDRPVVRRRLGRAAWRHEAADIREEMRALLTSEGWMETLPAWLQQSIALRQAQGCEAHRRRIDALVELGDPKGLRVLTFYRDLPKSGCGTLGTSDCFGCVRDDIREAIEALKQAEKNT